MTKSEIKAEIELIESRLRNATGCKTMRAAEMHALCDDELAFIDGDSADDLVSSLHRLRNEYQVA